MTRPKRATIRKGLQTPKVPDISMSYIVATGRLTGLGCRGSGEKRQECVIERIRLVEHHDMSGSLENEQPRPVDGVPHDLADRGRHQRVILTHDDERRRPDRGEILTYIFGHDLAGRPPQRSWPCADGVIRQQREESWFRVKAGPQHRQSVTRNRTRGGYAGRSYQHEAGDRIGSLGGKPDRD